MAIACTTASITNLYFLVSMNWFLRVGLQENEEEIAEDREGRDDYHEEDASLALDAVALHARVYSWELDDRIGDQEDGAVHFPLSLRIWEGIELEKWDARAEKQQEVGVVFVKIQEALKHEHTLLKR